MSEDQNLIEVKIGALIMDPNTNTPIVVLKGIDNEAVLPIWVGAFEANAIALEIEKVVPQRPMTHDLLRNIVHQTGMTASRVVITDLIDNTFFARIELANKDAELMLLDSRPSDAIALALRLDCPIFVEQKVLDLSAATAPQAEIVEEDEIDGDDIQTEDWPELID